MEAVRAIADPVRRDILALLRAGPRPAGAIAAEFAVSRPAVSRHLRVLREHGLVHDELRGRERVYRLDLAPLAPVAAWLAQLGVGAGVEASGRSPASSPIAAALGAHLDALETEVRRTRRQRRSAGASADTDNSDDTEENTA